MIQPLPKDAVLIIMEVQEGFDDPKWGRRNNPQAEQNIARLLEAWRKSRRPIVHVQHLSSDPMSPLHPDSPGNMIKKLVEPNPGEAIIQERVNSAFIVTDLEQRLREHQYQTLVITGLRPPIVFQPLREWQPISALTLLSFPMPRRHSTSQDALGSFTQRN